MKRAVKRQQLIGQRELDVEKVSVDLNVCHFSASFNLRCDKSNVRAGLRRCSTGFPSMHPARAEATDHGAGMLALQPREVVPTNAGSAR
jgi:hypothetical protein